MKRIDFENHMYDQSLYDVMEKREVIPYYRKETDTIAWKETIIIPQGKLKPMLLDIGENRLKLMDELGIDMAVISSSPGVEILDAGESVEVSRRSNDAIYSMTRKYPGRYLGSAILPVKDVAAACRELERCVKELGFVAWHTHSNYGQTAPDDAVYRPIFKKAEELGVYVYLHPQLDNNPRVQDYGFSLAGSGLGFTLDAMITITKLILSGIFDEMPNLTVLLGHLGEALPFLLARMDNRVKHITNPYMKNRHDPSYYFKKNILVTTSGNMSKEAFICARDVLGIDRILFAGDYPYEAVAEMISFLDALPITETEREAMYYRNASEKLGLSV